MALVFATTVALVSATAAQAAHERQARSSETRGGRVLAQLNDLRRARDLVPLRVSVGLTSAAREHSWEMARNGFFAHESLDGSSPGDRIDRYYPAAGSHSWTVGENLAWASPELGASRTLQMWLRSPAHRENLLAAEWREIGIGAVHVGSAPGLFGGASVTLVTVDFGVRR